MLLKFGAIPSALDRHVTEFFPQFFREGRYYGKKLGIDEFCFEGTIHYGDLIYQQMEEEAFSDKPLAADYFEHAAGEHEQVIDIIASIRQGRAKVYSANLPNKGQVPNLPPEAIIESPAVADGHGMRPLVLPPLPAGIAGVLATRYQWVEDDRRGRPGKQPRKVHPGAGFGRGGELARASDRSWRMTCWLPRRNICPG